LSSVLNNINNPLNNYSFNVITYGDHLDSIANRTLNKNEIPVYIANQDGDIVPIPSLNQVNMSFDIYIYFPIVFKDDFFRLGSYLMSTYVGQNLNYGALSGSGISNINVPMFGDLQKQQMNEFRTFINTSFGLEVVATELW